MQTLVHSSTECEQCSHLNCCSHSLTSIFIWDFNCFATSLPLLNQLTTFLFKFFKMRKQIWNEHEQPGVPENRALKALKCIFSNSFLLQVMKFYFLHRFEQFWFFQIKYFYFFSVVFSIIWSGEGSVYQSGFSNIQTCLVVCSPSIKSEVLIKQISWVSDCWSYTM